MEGVSELPSGSDTGIASGKTVVFLYRLILWNFIIQVCSWVVKWFCYIKHVIEKF